MANRKLHYSPPRRTCHSEIEIRNLFERHMQTLLDQKRTMINEINEWGNNLIRQIEENLDQQKILLERKYKNQLRYLHIRQQEFLDTALVYEERKSREDVRQLLEQCHAFKFHLGSLDYPEQSIPFIQLQKEQPAVEIQLNSFRIHKSDKQATINDDYRIEENENAHVTTSLRSNSIAQQRLTTSTHDDLSSGAGMTEKCPACCIIFPPTMGTNERTQHVNQHFGDS